MRKISTENAIAFTKLSLLPSFCWPPSATATRWQIVRFKVLRFFSYVNMWMLLVPLFLTFQDCSLDLCIKTVSLAIATIQICVQMILCYSQYNPLQTLIGEIEAHRKRANSYESEIFQQYVDRCAMFYACVTIWFYITALSFICNALFTSQSFPFPAKYPFEVEYQPVKTIIYLQQSISAVQIASILCVNNFVAILLWFAAAKFDILGNELRTVSNIFKLSHCIRKHREVLRFATEVAHTCRFMILLVIGCAGAAMLFGGITLLGRQPLLVKMQYLIGTVTCLLEVFMCCWPADNLLLASSNIGKAAYASPWYSQNVYLQSNINIILMRCQKPVTVSVACIIPMLSLQYFGSFISTACSYFTALRVVLNNENMYED